MARTIIKSRKLVRLSLISFSILTFYLYFSSSDSKSSVSDTLDLGDENVTRAVKQTHCQAMFTISDPYRPEWIPSPLLEDTGWYMTEELLEEASDLIQGMNRRREEGVGPSTDDYRDLARLLPHLLYFDRPRPLMTTISNHRDPSLQHHRNQTSFEHVPHHRLPDIAVVSSANISVQEAKMLSTDIQNFQKGKGQESGPADHLFSRAMSGAKVVSRFQSTGGIFPFIPCRIHQYSKSNVHSCLTNRLHRREKITVVFLGDSKVRNIWAKFLDDTSYLNYYVSYSNETVSWGYLKAIFKERKEFKYEDFDTTSSTYPQLRINMKFRRFWDILRLETCDEVVLLKEWASGKRPVPDLLIVGYTSWMLYLHTGRIDYRTNIPLDIVNLLFNLHEVIVPLLKEVSLRTKVLVHADPRVRPYGRSAKLLDRWLKNVLFHDSLIDWSELLFWHFLKKGRGQHTHTFHQLHMSYSLKTLDDALKVKENTSTVEYQSISAQEEDHRDSSPKYLNQDTSSNMKLTKGEWTSSDNTNDYLSDHGMWWWDTSLVLNLATISECSELYDLNMKNHPLYNGRELQCEDHHHAGSSTVEVEVQMLLNLICNSDVGTSEHICCS